MPFPSPPVSQPCCGTLWAPPFPFGRRPPQSNCPPATVPATDSGRRLERNSIKGGIPRLAPPKLALRLRSLPPILYMTEPHPMTGYSKAPRGLSVQLRGVRVFTNTTTSPSPWSRQRSSRYTIRAGRNLPDKEFRLASYSTIAVERTTLARRPCMSPCSRDHIII